MGVAVVSDYWVNTALGALGSCAVAALEPDVAKAMSTSVIAAIKIILMISALSLDCGRCVWVATACI